MIFIGETLPFVRAYVAEMDRVLRRIDPDAELTSIRKQWLGFCVVAFRLAFPSLDIRCVVADNLYGMQNFLDMAPAIFGGVQVISKLRKN